MKRLVSIIVLSILAITGSMILFSISAALANDESGMYLKAENFTWKEFDDTGKQLLKESGPIYGLGYSGKSDINTSLTGKGRWEMFGGVVDYDGQTTAGTPVKTDTGYFGMKVEGDLGWKFMVAKKSSIEPFAGLGWRWWNRSIQSTATVLGYDELWSSIYSRLGIRGNLVFKKTMGVFAEGGVKLPIYNVNNIDLFDVTVYPGNKPSTFAEAGFKWAKLKVNMFYEGMRFSKSAEVGIYSIYQPKSTADIYGVNVGVVF